MQLHANYSQLITSRKLIRNRAPLFPKTELTTRKERVPSPRVFSLTWPENFKEWGLKNPFFDFGLALRGNKISDFSTLGGKFCFLTFGLPSGAKKHSISTLSHLCFSLAFVVCIPKEVGGYPSLGEDVLSSILRNSKGTLAKVTGSLNSVRTVS